MKQKIRTIALLAVLGLAATGCQKESIVEPVSGMVVEDSSVIVSYTVDGETMQGTFADEAEWNVFLERLLALAEEGHRVSFRNAGQERSMTKETVTYVTKDHDEAHAWANAMMKQGYEVTIVFDDITHEYTCVAVK